MDSREVAYGVIGCILILLAGTVVGGLAMPRGTSQYSGYVVDVEVDKGIPPTTQIHVKTHPRSSASEMFCLTGTDEDRHSQRSFAALENRSEVTITYDRPIYVSITDCQRGTSIVRSLSINGSESRARS